MLEVMMEMLVVYCKSTKFRVRIDSAKIHSDPSDLKPPKLYKHYLLLKGLGGRLGLAYSKPFNPLHSVALYKGL